MSKEFDAMQRKYQNSREMFSVILEGPAIGYIRDKKKRAGVSGSRGKYISHCIVFYEQNLNQMKAMEKTIQNLRKKAQRRRNGSLNT